MPRHSLAGQVVAITGGARGIGLATARALHAAGARVAIGDLDREVAVQEAGAIGSDALAGHLDVTDRGSFERFVELVSRELGPLDVLVNNAGIMPIGPFVEESDETARRVVEVNILGVMTGMKVALPGMLARGRGQIVNVASVAGKSPAPGGASYCATKAAIVMLTETARVEHARSGVDFTCVMPSFTATELIAGTKGTRFLATVTPDAVGAAVARAIVTRRRDVYVPGSLAPIIRVQQLLGRRIRDAMGRALGADRTFLDVDRAARGAYDARISGGGAQPPPEVVTEEQRPEPSRPA